MTNKIPTILSNTYYRYGAFQICEVLSVIAILLMLSTDQIRTMWQIIVASSLAGICPGIRAALYVSTGSYIMDFVLVSGQRCM